MAEASGLHLLTHEERNPLQTSSYGTGQLINEALKHGVKNHFGIGGSATNDGGVGMLQALGVSFKDVEHNEIKPGGAALNTIDKIDTSHLNPATKR